MLSYKIMFDSGLGTSVYTTLATELTDLTYTAIGLTAGTTYAFKVYALNSVGYSLGSDPKSILAAQRPDVPSAPSTEISGNFVKVSWVAPFD